MYLKGDGSITDMQERKESFRTMKPMQNGTIAYSVFDPTGNITALVETEVELSRQPAVADEIMRVHPEVEQVGFLNLTAAAEDNVQAELRMAGGEFCGNATMCAAAMAFLHRRRGKAVSSGGQPEQNGMWESVRVRVSGAASPVRVCLRSLGEKSFSAGVMIPEATEIEEKTFMFQGLESRIPLVRMEGISHLIMGEDSPFFQLKQNPEEAEFAVKEWCGVLSVSGLGIMFLESIKTAVNLTPLVYVPESGTVFWENSCASGSAAVGMYMARESSQAVEITLNEPGGKLMVRCDPQKKETWLFGQTRFVSGYSMSV